MPLNSVLPPPPILPVTALQEQHFNEAALAAPVTHAALRAWTYPEPAVVLGRAQHQLALPAASAGALPVVVRGGTCGGQGGGARRGRRRGADGALAAQPGYHAGAR